MFFQEDPQYIDDDDDNDFVGTSPINLPDPSLFSDDHYYNDQDGGNVQSESGKSRAGPIQRRQFLEEENAYLKGKTSRKK